MLLYVPGWNTVNWGLQLGVGGLRFEGFMHVVVCSVFLSPSYCIANWPLLHRDTIIA